MAASRPSFSIPLREWTRHKPVRRQLLSLLLFNPALVLFLLAAGWLAATEFNERPPETAIDLRLVVEFRGWIKSRPEIRRESLYLILQPLQVTQKDRPVPFSGNLAVYLAAPSRASLTRLKSRLQFGDILEFTTLLHTPSHYAIPGVADFAAISRRAGIHYRASLKSFLQVRRSGSHFPAAAAAPLLRFADRFEERVRERFSAGQAQIILATFLGQTMALDEKIKRTIQELGIYHLFVVSGFHVSLIALFLHLAIRRRVAGMVLTVAGIWAYVLLTGWNVPAIRAGLMATFGYLLYSAGLTRNLPNAVGLSGLLFLLYQPGLLFTSGFQFSYFALLALAVGAGSFTGTIRMIRLGVSDLYGGNLILARESTARLRRKVRFTLEEWLDLAGVGLSASAAARTAALISSCLSLAVAALAIQLTVLPLSLYYSNLWSPGHLLTNLLFVPLVSLFVPLCFILLLLWWIPLGTPILWLVGAFAELLLELIRYAGRVNPVFYLPHPRFLEVAVYLSFLTVILFSFRRFRRLSVLFAPLLLIAVLQFPQRYSSELLEITMLDVGQGESIHLSYPDGTQGLVDTGGNRYLAETDFLGQKLLSRYLWQRRIDALDFVMITHADLDHLQGFHFLNRVFPPQSLYYSDPTLTISTTARAIRTWTGNRLQVGQVEHLFLHPPAGGPTPPKKRNNVSLVFKLRYRDFSMLFTGDIEKEAEELLAPSMEHVTVLKVPHHGSATSSSNVLLRALKPRIALISVGRRNPFGHPADPAVDRLKQAGAAVFSTSDWGSLRVVTDGHWWRLENYSMEEGVFLKRLTGPAQRE